MATKFTITAMPSAGGILVLPKAFNYNGTDYDLCIKAENAKGIVDLTKLSQAQKEKYFDRAFIDLSHGCLAQALASAVHVGKDSKVDFSKNLEKYSVTMDTTAAADEQITIVDSTQSGTPIHHTGLAPYMESLRKRVECAIKKAPTVNPLPKMPTHHEPDESEEAPDPEKTVTKSSSRCAGLLEWVGSRCCRKKKKEVEETEDEDTKPVDGFTSPPLEEDGDEDSARVRYTPITSSRPSQSGMRSVLTYALAGMAVVVYLWNTFQSLTTFNPQCPANAYNPTAQCFLRGSSMNDTLLGW